MREILIPESEGHAADSEAVLTWNDMLLAVKQCELQHATSEQQVQGMLEAFQAIKQLAMSGERLDAAGVLHVVQTLGHMVEPERARGWRSTAVVFANGNRGEEPEHIPRAMENWAEAFVAGELSPRELYYHYERIHPFEDGNGRTGHCLWAWACVLQGEGWPSELPPDVFAADAPSMEYQSAFGEVE